MSEEHEPQRHRDTEKLKLCVSVSLWFVIHED